MNEDEAMGGSYRFLAFSPLAVSSNEALPIHG